MAVFYAGVFNPNVYFTDSAAPEVVKTGTGGIDPGDAIRRRRIVKPTGLLHLPKKGNRKDVEDRVDESRQIQAEIAQRLAADFAGENAALSDAQAAREAGALAERAIIEMSLKEIDAEIGALLQNKLRTDEEEIMLLVLIAASA